MYDGDEREGSACVDGICIIKGIPKGSEDFSGK